MSLGTFLTFWVGFLGVYFTRGDATVTSCEDGWIAYEGSCYLFQNEQKLTNLDAERYCNHYHADLVFVNDVHENNFLKDFMNRFKADSYWVGITDEIIEGEWVSIADGSRVTYTDWSPGEPESFHHTKNEDCVRTDPSVQYRWFDCPCTEKRLPVCEKPGTEAGRSEIIG